MTSAPPAFEFTMDPFQFEENMEIGTSPSRHVEDINFEDLDPIQDQPVDNSMFVDIEFSAAEQDAMLGDDHNGSYHDDEMADDDEAEPPDEIADWTMEDDLDNEGEDEILYDEEAETYAAEEVPPTNVEKQQEQAIHTDPQMGLAEDMFENMENPPEEILDTNNDPPASIQPTDRDLLEDLEEQPADTVLEGIHNSNDVVHQAVSAVAEPHPQDENVHIAADKTQGGSGSSNGETITRAQEDVTHESATDYNTADNQVVENPNASEEQHSELQATDLTQNELDEVVQAERLVHAVLLSYLGEEMSLFPPTEGDGSDVFFLADSGLATQPFDKLLAACREVLGDSLGHDDELVIDIPSLGLHICEDSKYASELTLSQVLDVYLLLSNNESIATIQPLQCSLSSRVCLSTQFAYVASAAQEGRLYSEVAAECSDTPHSEASGLHEPEEVDLQETANSDEQEAAVESGQQDATEGELEPVLDEHQPASIDRPVSEKAESVVHTTQLEPVDVAEAAVESTELANNLVEDADPVLYEAPGSVIDPLVTEAGREIGGEDREDDQGSVQPNLHIYADTTSSHTIHGAHSVEEVLNRELESAPSEVADEFGNGEDDIQTADDEFNPEESAYQDDENQIYQTGSEQKTMESIQPDQNGTINGHGHRDGTPPSSVDDPTDSTTAAYQDDVEDELLATATSTVNGHDNTNPVHATPTKAIHGKRKVDDDEDDLDFLDLSTPEPKRTRSS